MAHPYETNTKKLMYAYRVVSGETGRLKIHDEEVRKTDVLGQNHGLRVIDGGLSDDTVVRIKDYIKKADAQIAHQALDSQFINKFSDGVIHRINQETDLAETQEIAVEYVGPKRLPKLSVVEKETEPQNQRGWNLINFFRRK